MKRMAHGARHLKSRVISNIKVTSNHYIVTLNTGSISQAIKPGQFFNIRCSNGFNPLLRRPFSVYRIRAGGIEILYKVVGGATALLSKKKRGDLLDIIGPLGNGFDPKLSAIRYPLNAILVAGGMGIAPLVALAQRLAYSVERIAYREKPNIYVFIGSKKRNDILCEKDFKQLGCKVLVSTENGSKGRKGLVTEVLKKFLSAKRYPLNAVIYACGPSPMLKEVARIAASKRMNAFGSFEEHMACGVGSCYGCVIKIKNQKSKIKSNFEYKRICNDGPVFDLREIVW